MGAAEIEIIAPMIFAIILTLTVAGVILLKPLSKQLGTLLEAMARERTEPQLGEEMGHMRSLLETIDARLALLEERQDFTDSLLQDPERRSRRRLETPSGTEKENVG
jgi:hypothetical protein